MCDDRFLLTPEIFPNSVVKLELTGEFNQKLFNSSYFPTNLQELIFGDDFDQHLVPGALPDTLTYLSLGESYNTELIEGFLPQKLQTLEFGNRNQKFNRPIARHVLPQSLCALDVGKAFHFPLTRRILPQGLRRLYVSTLHPDRNQMDKKSLECPLVEIFFGEYIYIRGCCRENRSAM